jgi:hypothetical protein
MKRKYAEAAANKRAILDVFTMMDLPAVEVPSPRYTDSSDTLDFSPPDERTWIGSGDSTT